MENGTPSSGETGLKEGPWTIEEDLKLLNYIHNHGFNGWSMLPDNTGLRRSGQSCIFRWLNYSDLVWSQSPLGRENKIFNIEPTEENQEGKEEEEENFQEVRRLLNAIKSEHKEKYFFIQNNCTINYKSPGANGVNHYIGPGAGAINLGENAGSIYADYMVGGVNFGKDRTEDGGKEGGVNFGKQRTEDGGKGDGKSVPNYSHKASRRSGIFFGKNVPSSIDWPEGYKTLQLGEHTIHIRGGHCLY